MREFWADAITQSSWEKLTKISKEFDFVLIGGWAAYLWTGKHKSRDIDIVVNHETLSYLKQKYDLTKNPNLGKYEIKSTDFDIDIYVPFFSKLKIPEQDILEKYNTRIRGIKVAELEPLLILKQTAYKERRGSLKGRKDEIDILTLLIHSNIDWKKYKKLLQEYKCNEYSDLLRETIRNFDLKAVDYLGISFKEFADWKNNS